MLVCLMVSTPFDKEKDDIYLTYSSKKKKKLHISGSFFEINTTKLHTHQEVVVVV